MLRNSMERLFAHLDNKKQKTGWNSIFFSSSPKGWNWNFSNYPFREWAKIGEI